MFIFDFLTAQSELFDNLADFDGVPDQSGIREKAQATDLVHYFFIIARSEFTVTGKEKPFCQSVPLLTTIELFLNFATHFLVSEIFQDEDGFDDSAQLIPFTIRNCALVSSVGVSRCVIPDE